VKLIHWCVVGLLLCGCVKPLPGPKPEPIPPVPIVEPITTAPLWVVILKDNDTLNQLPSSQIVAVMSGNVRDYCKIHCRPGTDGKTPEFHTYQWGQDVSKTSQAIQDLVREATADAKGSKAPWIAMSNGTSGFSGPFPATESEALELLAKYGGK